MLIFKIATATDWLEAMRAGRYEGSAHDKADGFIHFSTGEQLRETLRLHYSRVQDMLAISAVDADTLGDALKWEPSRGGDLFPHLYGSLSSSAVRRTVIVFYETLRSDAFADLADFIAGTGVHRDPPTAP